MKLYIEVDREEDGRWIAEVTELPGCMAYGGSRDQAEARAQAIAFRTIALKLESGELDDASVEWISNGPCDVEALEPELHAELEKRMEEVHAEGYAGTLVDPSFLSPKQMTFWVSRLHAGEEYEARCDELPGIKHHHPDEYNALADILESVAKKLKDGLEAHTGDDGREWTWFGAGYCGRCEERGDKQPSESSLAALKEREAEDPERFTTVEELMAALHVDDEEGTR